MSAPAVTPPSMAIWGISVTPRPPATICTRVCRLVAAELSGGAVRWRGGRRGFGRGELPSSTCAVGLVGRLGSAPACVASLQGMFGHIAYRVEYRARTGLRPKII